MGGQKTNTKRFFSGALLLGILTCGVAVLLNLMPSTTIKKAEGEASHLSKYDRMDLAMAQEVEMTKDPALGYVPRERLMKALDQAMRTAHSRGAIPGVEWIERGPDNIGGRTRAVIFDPNDPSGKAVFAGSVSGGLWKCTDITQPNPGWEPVNDTFANLAITTIAFDSSQPTTMYFGTGEGFFNGDAVRGDGIWKSTDGGNTWNQLSNTTGNAFDFVQKIVVAGNGDVFAATRSRFCNVGGIYRSTDGGASWSLVLSGGNTGGFCSGQGQWAADIEIAANGDLYAAMGLGYTDGIYKSTDGGTTWSAITGGGLPTSDYQRIELACAPSDANTVLAVMEEESYTGNNDCKGLYLSTDGGSTWTTLTMPVYFYNGSTDFTRGQSWYDLIAAFDPNDATRIYVGGIDIHLSEDQGNTWVNVGEWRGNTYQYVHADQHAIYFKPGSSSELLLGNDGGVYYSSDAHTSSPTIVGRNKGYNTIQYYAGDLTPTANTNFFIAGAQDNGSHRISGGGVRSGVEVTGGDGAFCHIDQNEAQYVITSYVYNNYRVSSDSGKTFAYYDLSDSGKFINPTDYDDIGDKLYCSAEFGKYVRWNNPQTGGSFDVINAPWTGEEVSAVTVDKSSTNTVWFGTDDGALYKVTDAHTNSPTFNDFTGSWGSNYISSITIDPSDSNHLLVTFSNYGVTSVYESTNGGTSWTDVEGNLPDMPVRDALFNPNNGDQVLLATEAGIWSTDNLDGGATQWAASNTGMATVRTDMLQYRTSDGLVLAATHGRGLYTSDVFTTATADFSANHTVAYIGQPVQFYDNSYQANSYSWNFGDGNSSTAQNPTHTYSTPGDYTVSLTINGTLTKTKSQFIRVLPQRSIPYKAHFGGDFEVNASDFGAENLEGTPFQRGNSSVTDKNGTNSGVHAWVTGLLESTYEPYTTAHLYTPTFDLSNTGTYTLSYQTNYDVFSNQSFTSDGFILEYSTDSGANWYQIGDYPGFYNFDNASQTTAFLTGVPHHIGNTNGYIQHSLDISSLAGSSSVAFRITFKSDYGNEYEGVAIDDLTITGPRTADSGKVLISQYRDGTDKGIELWNISNEDIDLSREPLQVYRYDNGATTPTLEVEVGTGTLAAGDVIVIGNASLQSYMNTYHPSVPFILHTFSYDGDDALEIVWRGYRNDVLGEIGVDPGTAWSGGGVSTNNSVIGLQPEIFVADTNGWADPSVRFRNISGGAAWSEFGLPPASVYTQSAWTYSAPDANSDSINFHLLDGNYSHSGDLAMQHLYVSSPAAFTLNSGTLTLTGDFENVSSPVVIEENASLLMTDGNATVSGDITTKRTGTQYSNIFNYWSTPVATITYNTVWNNFSAFNSNDLYLFDADNQGWIRPTLSANMPVGRGVAMTGLTAGGTNQRIFTGVPNNGDLDVTVFNNGGAGNDDDYNLIGNPYPSAVDAQAFLTDPDNSELVGSIWYWDRDYSGTHVTADYAQWTLIGGLCPSGCKGATGSLIPDQYIPAMQGFMVEADNAGDGTVTFKNDHRVSGNNNKFFQQVPIPRMWLSVTHESGASNGILIGFSADATDGYDRMYDGRKLSGNPDISFYTLIDSQAFAIQGRYNANARHEIPLGIRGAKSGRYTISLDTSALISDLTTIEIVNRETGQTYDLRKGAFTFTMTGSGATVERFHLLINGQITRVDPAEESSLQYAVAHHGISVWLEGDNLLREVALYDVQGRLVQRQEVSKARTFLPMDRHSSGIYFLRAITPAGIQTKKIFY